MCSDKTGGWSSVLHEVRFLLPDNVTSIWKEPCSVNSHSLGGTQKSKLGVREMRNMWGQCGKWVIALRKNQNVFCSLFSHIQKGKATALPFFFCSFLNSGVSYHKEQCSGCWIWFGRILWFYCPLSRFPSESLPLASPLPTFYSWVFIRNVFNKEIRHKSNE